MTFNVFGETLNLAQWISHIVKDCVKEYSSEYSDSAFKVEDTIVSRR